MGNRSSQNTKTGAANRVTNTGAGRSGGWGLRLFGQHTPNSIGSPAPGQAGHFADTWL